MAFGGNGRIAEGIGDIQTRVAEIEPLVEPLSTATDNDDLLTLEFVDAFEFRDIHESALAQFFQLQAERQGIEIVLSHRCFLSVCLSVTGRCQHLAR